LFLLDILMIKSILFDADGVIVQREMYFSQRFSEEFGVPLKRILPFFKQEYQRCIVGEADIKVELKKYVKEWGWEKSVDDLLDYWFLHERKIDEQMLEEIKVLRSSGVKCYLHTNNEKYRSEHLFEKVGLKKHFDGVFSSADLGFKKPQQEFWSAMYNYLDKPDKHNVLVWDNEEENVQSAKNFGFKAALYSNFNLYKRDMKVLDSQIYLCKK
jgi:putative hydrolase of the HAD superfamily